MWKDAAEIVARIVRTRRPIVLVGKFVPPLDIWGQNSPAVVPLAEVAALCDDRIKIDTAMVAALVADACIPWDDRGKPMLDEQQLRRLIRAQRKTELTDDVLVAAYKQYGSYRNAAEALAAQDVETDRWAVERAVHRAGGVSALRRSDSSSSVERARSSKRRNGRRLSRGSHTS